MDKNLRQNKTEDNRVENYFMDDSLNSDLIFKAFIASKCSLFIIHKNEEAILFANNGAIQMTGFSKDKFADLSFSKLFIENSWNGIKSELKAISSKPEDAVELEAILLLENGSTRNVLLQLQSVELKGEDVLLVNLSDIQVWKDQVEELLKYKEVYNAYSNVYMETNLEGRILFITPSIKNFLGYEPSEIIGRSSSEFYSDPDLRRKLVPIVLQNGAVSSDNVQIRHKDGNYVDVKASVILAHDKSGNPIFKSTFHDITELKRVQQELEEKNNRLEVLQKVQKEILKNRSVGKMITAALLEYRTLPVPTARVAVTLFDELNNNVDVYAVEKDNTVFQLEGSLDDSFTYRILKDNKTKRIGLFENLRNQNTTRILDLNNHSYICFPLLIANRLIGALTFEFSEQLPANKEYMDLLSEMSRQLAIAINNVLLNEELKSSIDRFKVLYEQEAMGVLETTLDGKILDANKRMLDVLGYKEHEFFGLTIKDLTYNQSDYIYEDKMIHDVVIDNNEPLAFTKRLKNKEENIVYAKIWITKVKGKPGESDYLLYFVEDTTELHKSESAILSALIEGQENERKRVAQELHDGLGQVLSVIKLSLYALQNEINSEKLDKLTNFAELAIKEYRAVSHNLIPPLLENNGLKDALNDLCINLRSSGNIEIDFNCNLADELPKLYAIETYRIIQELMNNTMKHANASKVILMLEQTGNVLDIEYSDNGDGFDMEEIRKKSWSMRKGIGISNIESRVKLLNGTITIKSEINKGTTCYMQFYINET